MVESPAGVRAGLSGRPHLVVDEQEPQAVGEKERALIVQTLGRIEGKVDKAHGEIAAVQSNQAAVAAQLKAHTDVEDKWRDETDKRMDKLETSVIDLKRERNISKGKILGFLAAWSLFLTILGLVLGHVL